MIYTLVGYISINLGIWLYYESLEWLIKISDNPPREWSEVLVADGANYSFAILFGWLYAVVYFSIWLIPVWIVKRVVDLVRKDRKGINK